MTGKVLSMVLALALVARLMTWNPCWMLEVTGIRNFHHALRGVKGTNILVRTYWWSEHLARVISSPSSLLRWYLAMLSISQSIVWRLCSTRIHRVEKTWDLYVLTLHWWDMHAQCKLKWTKLKNTHISSSSVCKPISRLYRIHIRSEHDTPGKRVSSICYKLCSQILYI